MITSFEINIIHTGQYYYCMSVVVDVLKLPSACPYNFRECLSLLHREICFPFLRFDNHTVPLVASVDTVVD